MKRLRFPMFFKFLVGCLTLAALLIIGGTFVVKNETRFRSRGNYLQKQDRRLEGYLDRVGRDMTATLELLADDDELRKAMGQAADPAPATAAIGNEAAVLHAKQMYDALSSKNGLHPDVFALFTPANRLRLVAPPKALEDDDLPQLAAVEKARAGSAFAHRVQVLEGVPYQMSALAIRGDKDQVVGGILVGVRLQRLFDEFAEQSDDQVDNQIRPTLIDGTTILASAWPVERRAELARAMQPDKYVRVTVGDDSRDVIRMKDGDVDFWSQDAYEGYKAGDAGGSAGS